MATSSSKLNEDFDSLTTQRLNNIYKRLMRYIRTYYWDIQGQDVDNIILEGIKDLYEGNRTYSSDKGFEEALYDVVRSRMSHLLHKRLNKRKIHREIPLDEVAPTLESEEKTPFEEEDYEKLWALICQLIGADDTVREIAEIKKDTPKIKPKELALKLGVPIKEITNALRRLNNIRLKLRKERARCPTRAKKQ